MVCEGAAGGRPRRPAGLLVLARVDGRPGGIVGVHRLVGTVGELKRMYVDPGARGMGLGPALVDAAVRAAAELGFTELRLQTRRDVMAAAHRCYLAAGFADAEPYGGLAVEGVATLGRSLVGVRA